MNERRPDPETMLERVRSDDGLRARGRLKIFFGMAPGVGKSYAMLEAARKVAKQGADLVVGYLEPHARPETYALLMGLELLPRRSVEHRGRTLLEFDLEAALRRKPAILVLDELAHTNAPGSNHAKRWQDVDDLLAAGIDVFTTLNVQHLESLNDVVAQVTSVPVRETVPDRLFEEADEVELVDISPEDLIARLREGKVYVTEQAARAIENFFRRGNLIALRELALRKTADRVGAQAIDYRRQYEVERIWPTRERLLVCVGPSPLSARLIRAARRMAVGLQAPWIALHVELAGAAALSGEDRRRLEDHLRLAEELGATIATVEGDSFADAVCGYCRRHNVTKIVAGKPRTPRWVERWRGSLVNDLIRASGEIDVYVITGDEPRGEAREAPAVRTAVGWRPYAAAAAVVGLCTGAAWCMAPLFEPTNLAMLYLAGVVGVALTQGRGPSIAATVVGVGAFDLLFVPPRGTFAVSDTQYLVTFGIMLATGVVVSELAARVRAHARSTVERERRTAALYELSRELAALPTRDAAARAAVDAIRRALDVDAWIWTVNAERRLEADAPVGDSAPPTSDAGVVRWVFEHQRPAGCGADALPGAAAAYLPLAAADGPVGVLGVRPKTNAESLDLPRRRLLEAFASQTAGALERCALAELAERSRLQMETERMRSALLSAVSHDLRTPLATIAGAAGTLHDDVGLDECRRRLLADSIVDEAERLNRLVANLLDITRLEARSLDLHKELQPIEETVGVALERMTRPLREHTVRLEIADDLPPVAVDGLLLQQLLVNLLDNAAKFSPPGSTIELRCRREGGELWIEVADRGPGLPAGEERRVFDKFYRIEGRPGAGSGVGLAICKAIAELHDGRMEVENRPGGGALFRTRLPLPTEAA